MPRSSSAPDQGAGATGSSPVATLLPAIAKVGEAIRRHLSVVTPTGWTCLGLLVVLGVAGARLGWQEAWSAAGLIAVLVCTCWLWLLPRGGHQVTHELLEPRVVVGQESAIHVIVSNPSARPLMPARMEMPVGEASAVFAVPTLMPGAKHEEGFVLPTARRGVYTVGPVLSVAMDPVGLVRRERVRTEPQTVHVHPRTVHIGTLLHGIMRDIEGAVTQELSSSDVSFHALRDYVPGDDRRNVHWKTTARTGRLMIRQFEETHRASLLVLLDAHAESYETSEDFETAISVACSLALDAIRDGREVRLMTQNEELPTVSVTRLLDASCLITLGADNDGAVLARQAHTQDPEASVMALITGQDCHDETLSRVRAVTPVDVVALTLRCGSQVMARHNVGTMTVLDIDRVQSLPKVLRRAL